MARIGTTNQGLRRVTAHTNEKEPQKKIRMAPDTAMRCAAAGPNRSSSQVSVTSNRTLCHCVAIHSPGSLPCLISVASQALYTWLPRSPAWMRDCQKQGIRTAAEMSTIQKTCRCELCRGDTGTERADSIARGMRTSIVRFCGRGLRGGEWRRRWDRRSHRPPVRWHVLGWQKVFLRRRASATRPLFRSPAEDAECRPTL